MLTAGRGNSGNAPGSPFTDVLAGVRVGSVKPSATLPGKRLAAAA